MLTDLSGKIALVTGTASGIGRGLAEVLAERGMKVVATDINEDALAETNAALSRSGVPFLTSPLDIRDAAAWEALLDRAERELGPVQLLANIAGVTVAPTPALELSSEAWNWVMDTNVTGTWNGVTAVGRRLRDRALPGHIVNTSSTQGLMGAPNFAAYNAAKFAIMGLSETLRIELAQYDIGVSVVCPGPTKGNILNNSRKIAPHLVNLGKLKGGPGFSHYQMPRDVAEKVADAVERNQLFVVTHPEYKAIFETRWRVLEAAMGNKIDAAAESNIREVEGASLACYQDALRNY
ncbi:MAG: SDR family oxidoreductase [Porticoccaceae bacterium]